MLASRKRLGLCIALMVIILFALIPTASANSIHPTLTADKQFSDNLPNSDYYILQSDVVIQNSGSELATKVRLEVPLMADLDSPYQDIVNEEFSHQPIEIKRLDNGNRVGVFSLDDIEPGTSTILTQKYKVRVDGTNWLENGTAEEIVDPGQYLVSTTKIECADPQIQAVASLINPNGAMDDLSVANKALEFTRSRLTYNLNSPSANQGALAGLQTGSGCCEEYASLFVALCRASGVPARVVNGYASDRDELAEDENPINMKGRRHQWAEFYLDGKGWIPVDPTLSNESNQVFGGLPTGCYVAENYGDHKVTGKYRGGKLAIQFQDKVARGY